MGRPGALLPGLLLALLAGCVTGPGARPDSRASGRLGTQTALPPDAVQIEVAVIERPAGDAYLNHELWGFMDEQIVDLEHKAKVEDNGFRVGQVVGMTPAGLQSLLTSERACANPRRYLLGPGKSAVVTLGPTVPQTRFKLDLDGEPIDVSLDQAQFSLVVAPTLTADARTRLRFTPQVHYGEQVPDFQVAPDSSGYVMEIKRPCKTYPSLAWEATVAPNQYLVVGTWLEQSQKLGYQCFVDADCRGSIQRLLVIRTNRGLPEPDDAADRSTVQSSASASSSLVLQAATPAGRASRP
jgi:hypothetical protein